MPDDLEGLGVHPLAELFEPASFPLAELIPQELLGQVFSGLYYTAAVIEPRADGVAIALTLALEGELALSPPGTQALALVLGSAAGDWTLVDCELLIGAMPSFALPRLPIRLRVPRDVLRDVATDAGAEVLFEASLALLPDGTLVLDSEDSLTLPRCEVLHSGLEVELAGVQWNFERGASLPSALAAGVTGEFLGIAFEQGTVYLPPALAGAPQIALDSLCIGSGGLHGGVALRFATPPSCQLAGFTVSLESVGLRFLQSRIVQGELAATVRDLPLFDCDVGVDLVIGDSALKVRLAPAASRQGGNASVQAGLVTLTKPGLLSMSLQALEVEVDAAGGALTLSGRVQPLFEIPGATPLPGFALQALRLGSDGSVSVQGGWIDLPQAMRIQLGPVALELTRVGLGNVSSTERWIAFSGGLSLAEGIPISAAVEGLKIRFDAGGVTGIELEGVKLRLEIPDVLLLDGQIRYIADGQRFDGAGTLMLQAANLLVSVRIVLGRRDDYPYFYLYLMLAPPVGVPIAQSGLAFYGVEALFAMNMRPDKTPEQRWYLDWYHRPEIGAVDQTKWADTRGAMAFGGGVILGTFPDKGYGVAVKGLLVLVLPGPVLMLDAKANVLKDPTALALPESQALFNALVIYDVPQGTIELGIEPHYVFPDAGELVDVTGVAEAFYSFSDPRAWHVYLGRREHERRIRARLLSLFEANAYLMLDAGGMELGGYIGYDAHFDAGPVAVGLTAFIEGAAQVSWRPQQLQGGLHLEGAVLLQVAGVGVDLGVSALLQARSPQPFEIDGEVKVRADLPWPAEDFKTTLTLHWEAPGPPRVVAPLQSAGAMHPLLSVSWALGSGEPVLPLDVRFALAFERDVRDLAGIDPAALPAAPRVVGEYRLSSRLDAVELSCEQGGQWVPYASVSGHPRPLNGMWQQQGGDATQGNRRLMLQVRTPFFIERLVAGSALEPLLDAEAFDPCSPYEEARRIDFESHPNLVLVPFQPIQHGQLDWSVGSHGGEVVETERALAGQPRGGPWPRRYYRGLFVPDQFSLVTVGDESVTPGAAGTPVPVHPALRIRLDRPAAGVAVLLAARGGVRLRALDGAGTLLAIQQSPRAVNTSVDGGGVEPLQLRVFTDGIRTLEIETAFALGLLEIVLLSRAAGTDQEQRRQVRLTQLERFSAEEPLLEPDRRYRLRITTSVRDEGGLSLQGAQVQSTTGAAGTFASGRWTFVDEFSFRTEGPPGDAQLAPTGPGADARAPLDTLDAYLREAVPARGAPNHYRAYDLALRFRADYLNTMYTASGRSLAVLLTGDDGSVVTLHMQIGAGWRSVLTREERLWRARLERSSCQLQIDDATIVRETEIAARTPATQPLAPTTRYDAVLQSTPAGRLPSAPPLFAWSFVSSRFLGFAEHWGTPALGQAIELPSGSGTLWLARAVTALAAGDPWAGPADQRERRRLTEVEAFDAMARDLALAPDLPETTSARLVRLAGATPQATQPAQALLVESPEPFDWVRLGIAAAERRWSELRPGCLLGWLPSALRGAPQPVQRSEVLHLRLLRDWDGTRALVLMLDAQGQARPLPQGDYALTLSFRLDVGEQAPLLARQGSHAAESASLQWRV